MSHCPTTPQSLDFTAFEVGQTFVPICPICPTNEKKGKEMHLTGDNEYVIIEKKEGEGIA